MSDVVRRKTRYDVDTLTNLKGPCAHIVCLYYLCWDYFKAKVYTVWAHAFLGKWIDIARKVAQRGWKESSLLTLRALEVPCPDCLA